MIRPVDDARSLVACVINGLGTEGHWIPIRDADPRAKAIALRHYSTEYSRTRPRRFRTSRRNLGFIGTGDHLALMTANCDALFVWQRYPDGISQGGEHGVICSLFRNEGHLLSSMLILEAEVLAWKRWPGQRLFTYVWDAKVKSANPGYCFKMAGWKPCGRNKDGRLTILEKLP